VPARSCASSATRTCHRSIIAERLAAEHGVAVPPAVVEALAQQGVRRAPQATLTGFATLYVQITGLIATMAGPSQWFTGAVHVDAVAAPSEPSRLQAASVHFTPARTAWHPPVGADHHVTEGVGRPAPRRADRGDPTRRSCVLRARGGPLAQRH
jgi:hypothetical protein